MAANTAEGTACIRGREVRRRDVNLHLHVCSIGLLVSFFFAQCTAWTCYKASRDALLEFRNALIDPTDTLFSTWDAGEDDCCKWQHVTCVAGHVTMLSIVAFNSTSGEGEVYRNTSYTGRQLGSSLVDLQDLQTLKLQWISFNCTIPADWGSFCSITSITLNDCDLQGSIPSNLANVTNLQHVDLESNTLTGSIPGELCNLKHLNYLDVAYNDLNGAVPSCLYSASGITTLLTGHQAESTPADSGGGGGSVSGSGGSASSGAYLSGHLPFLSQTLGLLVFVIFQLGYQL